MTAPEAEGIELLIALAGSFTTDDGHVTIRLWWRDLPGVYQGTCEVCRRPVKRDMVSAYVGAPKALFGMKEVADFLDRHHHSPASQADLTHTS